jgi:hypothetical protein
VQDSAAYFVVQQECRLVTYNCQTSSVVLNNGDLVKGFVSEIVEKRLSA